MKKILYTVFVLMIATSLMAAKRPQWNKTSTNKTYQVYAGTVAIVAPDGLDVFASSATYSPTIKLYGGTGEVEATLLDADTATVDTLTSVQINVTSVTASGEITTGYGYYHDRGNAAVFDFDKSTITTDGNWHDLSFSTIVPSGAKTLLLRVKIKHTSSVPKAIGFRKNGSSNAYNASYIQTTINDVYKYGDIIVPCDENRVIEYSAESVTTWSVVEITVGGWWK